MLFISAQLLKTIIVQYNNNKTHILGTITIVAYAETYQQYGRIMESMIFAGTCPSLLSLSAGILSIILYSLTYAVPCLEGKMLICFHMYV